MPPAYILDPSTLDLSKVVADVEAIRQVNPQRFAMEQLTAIVLFDPEQHVVAGYKDVRPDEFWVPGHMPGFPLMPGVLICEAAAQLCSWYTVSIKFLHGDFLGFGGMENVRFRAPVRPGDRLVLIGKAIRMHRRQTAFTVQGFVKDTMVFQGDIIGVPMTGKLEDTARTGSPALAQEA
jgi:3-hydroxyacyl-[acyl-carrier-protein] dehydratase